MVTWSIPERKTVAEATDWFTPAMMAENTAAKREGTKKEKMRLLESINPAELIFLLR